MWRDVGNRVSCQSVEGFEGRNESFIPSTFFGGFNGGTHRGTVPLLRSFVNQEFKDFEILVVDQNRDSRVSSVLVPYERELDIRLIATPTRQGISCGRNDGWRQARGNVIVFPDDDCWYPSWFLRKGIELLDSTVADLVSGRFADEVGRSINGRFASRAQRITRRNVWLTQSESASFYSRELLERLGGFDEELGVGSFSPWQAAEGPDLILKSLERRFVGYYDPSLYGFHHEYDLDDPSGRMKKRGRMYARGMGYVLRRHRFGIFSLLHWASRPLLTALVAAIRGKSYRARYALSVALGRLEGWTGRLWTNEKKQAAVANSGRGGMIADTAPGSLAADHKLGSSATFGRKLREMTGPYRARNPLLVASLYTADAFARLLSKPEKKIRDDRPLRILVANWGHLGDVVSILPLLKFLEDHPRVQDLGVLIGSWSRPVLEASDIAARIHLIDHWALDRSDRTKWDKITRYLAQRHFVIQELRQAKYDLSIDTFASFPSSHSITWGASIPRRVGFTSAGLGPLLTDPFDWSPDNRFMLDHQLELLQPLLGSLCPKTLPASYPGFASSVPPQGPDLGSCPYIVIHMGPQNIRGWIFEKWISLAAALKRQGYELVATGGLGSELEALAV